MTETTPTLDLLDPLLADPEIHTIMINGPEHVYVSRQAFIIEEVGEHFRDQAHLMEIIERILKPTGRMVNESNPIIDVRLQDWTLIHVVMPPIAPEGPMLTIRKFAPESQLPTFETLVSVGSMTDEMVQFLQACATARVNIVVCGGTGSGKTTLLNLIANLIYSEVRILLVEKEPELILTQKHVVRLTARPANAEGKGEIGLQQLVESAMKMRPDRIVCSEVYGGEVYPLLQAMSSGVEGSMFSVHATSPRDALARLEVMVASANPALPLPTIRQQISSSINLIIEMEIMLDGWRRVQKISAVTGVANDFVQTTDLFEFVQTGINSDGTVVGHYTSLPNLKRLTDRLLSGRKQWARWLEDSMSPPERPPSPPAPPAPPRPE